MVDIKHINAGIMIGLAAICIAYVIAMFVTFKNKTGIFTPYVRPTPPETHWSPRGTVTPYTPEEFEQKNNAILESLNRAS